MTSEPESIDGTATGLQRRDFLKVGVGFSVALTLGTAIVGCGDAPKGPAQGFAFLLPGDVELFTSLAPAMVVDLANFDEAQRKQLVREMLRIIDGTLFAMGQGSQKEVRKLLDLLAIKPLRYALTGVGAWSDAGVEKLQSFLERWRGSRFATLNAGGNVLVKLVSSSFYLQPASWPSAGYPGPLDYVFNAVNA